MANIQVVSYSVAVLISTLFLLDFGADKFVDHTAIVARRTKIPEATITLLTAGAEWEELIVVIASLAQQRASLAVGNIIGSAIANILGAFSLGLLCLEQGKPIQYSRSARIYSLLLLLVTSFVTPVIYFSTKTVWLICGPILIAFFGLYVGSIGWAISKGSLTAPVVDSGSDSSDDDDPIEPLYRPVDQDHCRSTGTSISARSDEQAAPRSSSNSASGLQVPRGRRHSLKYHIWHLVVGFLAISLAGYIISQASITIIDEFGISDVLFGVVVVAIATTLPEKVVAVLSSYRGHTEILVASTAGSNIFLLLLCFGIIMIDTSGNLDKGNGKIAELGVLWGSTLAFTLTVWLGERFGRWIGAAMLVAYIAFVALEFLVIY